MPQYQFSNKKGEIKDFYFPMSSAPSIGSEVVIEGKKWKRVPSNLGGNIDTKIDPFSTEDFLRKTDKKDTMGSIFDLSKELSEKRKARDGTDPLQAKFFSSYKKSRAGMKHLDDPTR
jgi:hypothetical protein